MPRPNFEPLPRRVVAALDTETTNIETPFGTDAFVCLFQLGTTDSKLKDITPANVRDLVSVEFMRDASEVWPRLDMLAEEGKAGRYVPVVAIHNLAFDMYSLAEYLLGADKVKVLAKSPQKPITFSVQTESGEVVFWDTLGFSGMGLDKMGQACGVPKLKGDWDYSLIRTPETPLTDNERAYAAHDIYSLFAWLGWYTCRNTAIDESELGYRVTTKTGAVRAKRRALIEPLQGKGLRFPAGEMWKRQNRAQAPRTDEELYTMQAATRGGFTFVSSRNAAVPIDDHENPVRAYDATSQHPAQMACHLYPVEFEEADPDILRDDLRIIEHVTPARVLEKFHQPFPVAFYGEFEFLNLRPKKDSVFARDGVYSLAFARLGGSGQPERSGEGTDGGRAASGYVDTAEYGCIHLFGKVVSASIITLFLTELDYWIMTRIYDWDAVTPVSGYETARYTRPTDVSLLSVMRFYGNKNSIKQCRKHYYACEYADAAACIDGILPSYLRDAIASGQDVGNDLEDYYLQSKADLNALFGVESTNEARRDMELTPDGLEYTGPYGVEAMPKQPKAWYQYGQRIVGWSRVAQTLMIEGLGRYGDVINGDTDSLKIHPYPNTDSHIEAFLARYAKACDKARAIVCRRVERRYKDECRDLTGIGHYIEEGRHPRFYSAWNKAYCFGDGPGDWHITLAGMPSGKGEGDSLEDWAAAYEQAHGFAETARTVLGYNVSISPHISKLNGRTLPHFGDRWRGTVTDWRGGVAEVDAPAAIGISPMVKTLGGFGNRSNLLDYEEVKGKGAHAAPVYLDWKDGKPWVTPM